MYEAYVMHIRALMTECAIEMARAMTSKASPWRSISQVDFHFGRARITFDEIAEKQLFESIDSVRKCLQQANDVCLYIFSENKRDQYCPWFRHLWKCAELLHKMIFDIDEIICRERGMMP